MYQTRENKRIIVIIALIVCFFAATMLFSATEFRIVKAGYSLADKIAAIEGKTYYVNSSASPSEFAYIYTDSMQDKTNDKVIVSYKIDEANDAAGGRIGIAWGQSYEGNSFCSSTSKGCLFFEEYPTGNLADNIFFKESLEGKYVTFVISRSSLSCPVYVSDTAPEFGAGMAVTNGVDAGIFAYQMTGYSASGDLLNIHGYGSNTDILTDNKVIGVMIGEGTGKISELKVFDENGNDLGINVTGDFISTESVIDLDSIPAKTVKIDSASSPSEFAYIYTDSMQDKTNDKVIVSYKIDDANDAASGRIGIAWGQSYEGNSFFSETSKGCLFFEDYPTDNLSSNIFFEESLEGKYVTFVISRSSLSCPVYVSDTAPEFGANMAVANGVDAGSFAYQMTGYSASGDLLNIYGYGSNTDILTDNKVIGVMIGEGTGKISELRVFDESGNNLGVNFTGDYYNYVISADEIENGSVSISKTVVLEGEEVTITSVADAGYVIKSLKVNGTEIVSQLIDNKYTFTATTDTTIVASYQIVEYTATVTVYGNEPVEVKFNVDNKAEKLAEIKAMMTADTTEYDYSDIVPEELPLENITITETRTLKEYTATVTVYGKEPVEIKFNADNKAEKLAEIKAMMTADTAEYDYSDNIPEELPLENITITETRTEIKQNKGGCNSNVNGNGFIVLALMGVALFVLRKSKKHN